eukprot:3303138-Alexandrium_andersonii.AAC.1
MQIRNPTIRNPADHDRLVCVRPGSPRSCRKRGGPDPHKRPDAWGGSAAGSPQSPPPLGQSPHGRSR